MIGLAFVETRRHLKCVMLNGAGTLDASSDDAMIDAVAASFEGNDHDPDCRGTMLTGAKKTFNVGETLE